MELEDDCDGVAVAELDAIVELEGVVCEAEAFADVTDDGNEEFPGIGTLHRYVSLSL